MTINIEEDHELVCLQYHAWDKSYCRKDRKSLPYQTQQKIAKLDHAWSLSIAGLEENTKLIVVKFHYE